MILSKNFTDSINVNILVIVDVHETFVYYTQLPVSKSSIGVEC